MTGDLRRSYYQQKCCATCGRPIFESAKAGIVLQGSHLHNDLKSIKLSMREADIAESLLVGYPEAVSRVRIFERVWGNNADVFDKILDVYMVRMRRKLRTIGLTIYTVYGVGYQLAKK